MPPFSPFTPYFNYGNLINRTSKLNVGLLGWWLALPQRGRGNTFFDLGNRFHGTLTNGPTWGNLSRPGGFGAITFDNTDDAVLVTDDAALEGMAALTLCAWHRTEVASNTFGRLVVKNDTDYAILRQNATSFRGMIQGTTADTGSVTISAGTWHHVCMVYDGANMTMYFDGEQSGTPTAKTGAVPSSASDLIFGNRADFARPLNGTLDDIRLFNVAKSASEIRGIYTDSLQRYPLTLNRIRRPAVTTAGGAGGGGAKINMLAHRLGAVAA